MWITFLSSARLSSHRSKVNVLFVQKSAVKVIPFQALGCIGGFVSAWFCTWRFPSGAQTLPWFAVVCCNCSQLAKQCVGTVDAPRSACALQNERDSPFSQLLQIQKTWAAAFESARLFTAFYRLA